jgi:hypothetical protein
MASDNPQLMSNGSMLVMGQKVNFTNLKFSLPPFLSMNVYGCLSMNFLLLNIKKQHSHWILKNMTQFLAMFIKLSKKVKTHNCKLLSFLHGLWWPPDFPQKNLLFEIYLYMRGKCERQNNPGPNLHMQEQSKYRQCISTSQNDIHKINNLLNPRKEIFN